MTSWYEMEDGESHYSFVVYYSDNSLDIGPSDCRWIVPNTYVLEDLPCER